MVETIVDWNKPRCSLFQTLCDLRTLGILYFRYFKMQEYKMFLFSAIMIFENSLSILESRQNAYLRILYILL